MANAHSQPIAALVPSAATYLSTVAEPAVRRAIASPDDASLAVSAFTLLYHVKDWALRDGLIADENAYWDTCPFAQMTAEVATGGKHMTITNSRFAKAPAALEFRSCSFGEGGYGVGPYGVVNIQIKGHKAPGDQPMFYSTDEVLTEVREWWRNHLKL